MLALSASPRRRGASSGLLASFLRGLRGWRIVRFRVFDLNIRPCRGCHTCLRGRPCPQHDFMPKLIALFDRADALVLASPVYFYGFPAPMKAVIDRCHPLWHSPRWRRRPKRPAFFLSTCDARDQREFSVMVRQAKAFFNTSAFQYCAEVLVSGQGTSRAGARLSRGRQSAFALARRVLAERFPAGS